MGSVVLRRRLVVAVPEEGRVIMFEPGMKHPATDDGKVLWVGNQHPYPIDMRDDRVLDYRVDEVPRDQG